MGEALQFEKGMKTAHLSGPDGERLLLCKNGCGSWYQWYRERLEMYASAALPALIWWNVEASAKTKASAKEIKETAVSSAFTYAEEMMEECKRRMDKKRGESDD